MKADPVRRHYRTLFHYRCVFPSGLLDANLAEKADGRRFCATCFLVGCAAHPLPPSPLPPSTMKLASAFESWGPDIQILARCMDQNASAWPLFGTWPPLPVYVKGRVALLGDAVSSLSYN